MICSKCNDEIPEGEEMNYMGRVLCEDCYIDAVSMPKTCDVAAVYNAKLARKRAGQTGTDGLNQLQKDIYEYVKEKGQITPEKLAGHFNLSIEEFQRNFTILRHCELIKGTKIDGVVHVLLMEGGPGAIDMGDGE